MDGKGLGQTERGEPYQVMIHVDAEVLAGRFEYGRSELDSGEGISAEFLGIEYEPGVRNQGALETSMK